MSTIGVTPGSGRNVATYQDGSGNDHPAGVMEILVSGTPTAVSSANACPIYLTTAIPAGSANIGHVTVDNAAISVTQSGAWAVSGSGVFNVMPASPSAGTYLPVRLSDGSAFYTASGGGGGGGGTSSTYGAAVPATGTAVGWSDGTNMQPPRVFDLDSGAGTQYVGGVSLRGSSSGGSVELATASNPLRTDPTGTTVQPVSVSNTVTVTGGVALSSGSAVIGHVVVDSGTVSGIVTANLGTLGGAATDATVAKLTVSPGASLGSNTGAVVLGSVTTAAPTYTTGQVNAVSMTTAGAVRVDGSGTTQPVSGTVTANAGTNLNTSLLALETGGNLATLAGSVTSSKVQINNAQINGVAPSMGNGVSGTGVQRVTIASDSTGVVGLAAGTSTVGAVIAAQQTNQLYTGTTALTPQFATVSASTSGDANTVVAAQGAGKKIRVLRWFLSFSGAVNVKFRDFDGASTYTDLTGLMYGAAAGQSLSGAYCPVGHFISQSNHALTLNLSAATAVAGYIVYTVE